MIKQAFDIKNCNVSGVILRCVKDHTHVNLKMITRMQGDAGRPRGLEVLGAYTPLFEKSLLTLLKISTPTTWIHFDNKLFAY